MAHWLAERRTMQAEGVISRFDPVYWTVDFPRPMMASIVTTAPDALRVDCVFYRTNDLAGLIWEAEDRHDHVLLAYETSRDFRQCRLSFRWRSSGVLALDAVNGPVLTIEGRDAAGNPRAWYVRLWNYAAGTPEDALVSIDFASVQGGFLLPGEADPVWRGMSTGCSSRWRRWDIPAGRARWPGRRRAGPSFPASPAKARARCWAWAMW